MKSMFRFVCSVVLMSGVVLSFVGCDTKQEFNSDSFAESVVLSGVVRDLGVEWSPESMWVVQDSMVVISNKGSRQDSMYMVVNGSDWSVRYIFGSRETGFAKPDIVKNSDVVMTYDNIHNRFTKISTRGEISHMRTGVNEEDIPSEITCINGAYYYRSTPFNSADVIVKIEKHNRTQIHDFMPQLQATRTPYGYYGSMVVSPRGDKFLYAYKYLHRFDIFNSNGKLLSENSNSSAPFVKLKDNGGVDRLNSNIYYSSASATEDAIYLYYIGVSEGESKQSSDAVTYVEVFDWSGTPIKRYQLNGVYSSVMYINGSFVAISPEGDSRFVTYSIE
ncbi:MAG: hypothetical protein SNH35_06440 [Rikenellaceae bacterium]